jgi:hypothetical protein
MTTEQEEELSYMLSHYTGTLTALEFTKLFIKGEDRKEIVEAKAYLTSTDYKVLPDYDGDTTGIVEARAEARNTIRSLEKDTTNG